MIDFRQAVRERILILDGAMGTLLQERGLPPGGSPEAMNLDAPEIVEGVHRDYVAAGADIIVANSFGGSRTKLANYGLQDRVGEINRAAVEIARRAAGDSAYVAASIGPTGRFLEPVGDAGFDEMTEIFAEQVKAFVVAGADLISFETFLDIRELRAAVIAAREHSDLPLMAMMTFDDGGRTVLGTPPEAAAVTLEGLGVDLIGTNCGLGIDGVYEILAQMRAVTSLPLIAQANAGLPVLRDGETVFPASPEEMTRYHDRLAQTGVRVLGGCCGTTPEHIRAMKTALQGTDCRWEAPQKSAYLSSRSQVVAVGLHDPCVVIGERINPTGKKTYSEELRQGKTAYVRREAQQQSAAGADLLDVNCGAPGVDEPLSLERAVYTVSSVCGTPLVLDSSDPEALERGLKAADGRVLINSVSGEDKSLKQILPLAKKYGAAVIALTLDRDGIPEDAEGRLEVARSILQAAVEAGLSPEDVLVDCLTLTVSAEQERAMESLRALRLVRQELKLNTVLGVSNISFGLPRRPVLSSVFFAMALEAGLGAAIINPKDERMMDAYRAALVLLGQDKQAQRYISHYGQLQASVSAPVVSTKAADIRQQIATAVIEGNHDGIVALVEQALQQGLEVMEVSNEGLLPGLEEVGRRFGAQQIFLPQVILSAETMQAGFTRLKQEMAGQAIQPLGRILMATVEGDIHDIGKNIVCTLLESHGFAVIDLGKNVPAKKIVQRAREEQVDAVGLSALMTTTLKQMQTTIDELREAGVKVFTMVGGAVVTQDYATEIGADLYAADALEAVDKIKTLLNQQG
ncbi:MAG: 5-methyltetrahydrofolate--homocysteine methyltransferase [Desulfuromonas sp.]|nr:MAG: 5-methyltetrahydrofolate--homocysteine methyltransferase [Desulfuromonas sp.]